MKNIEGWQPTKYSFVGGKVRASRDGRFLAPSSWLIASAVARHYSAALPSFARGRLVDLGCGRVPLYAAYRANATTITCVDWPQTIHGVDHVDVQCDISGKLPLPDNAFDTAILSDVLEHIPEPSGLWEEMHRILAPGGHLILNVPFLYWIHEAPHDYYRYTEFALQRFATQSGFQIVTLVPVGGSLEVVADIVGKHLVRTPLIGTTIARLLGLAVNVFGSLSIGQRVAASTGRRFPLGYFLVARRGDGAPNAGTKHPRAHE